jgi:hypothetical protein
VWAENVVRTQSSRFGAGCVHGLGQCGRPQTWGSQTPGLRCQVLSKTPRWCGPECCSLFRPSGLRKKERSAGGP